MSFASKKINGLDLLKALVVAVPISFGLNAAADTQAAAFLQPDPVTKKIPYQAIKITRNTTVMNSDAPIQACDRLEFVGAQNEIKKVIITTYSGGKNLVLDTNTPVIEKIACGAKTMSSSMAGIWSAISGGDRASYSSPATTKGSSAAATRSASTRGAELALPIFSADRSDIIAGKRSLVVPWVGGNSPYKVVLKQAQTGKVLAEVRVESGHQTRLPEIDLQPGQYSITVFNTSNGGQPGLEEQNLYVVNASELPAVPAKLKNANIDPVDSALLYVYYLEGFGDGRWAFEAFQRASDIKKPTVAVTDWLETYGSSK
jgi:hypothetical protein